MSPARMPMLKNKRKMDPLDFDTANAVVQDDTDNGKNMGIA
jgi:hypothetical protein